MNSLRQNLYIVVCDSNFALKFYSFSEIEHISVCLEIHYYYGWKKENNKIYFLLLNFRSKVKQVLHSYWKMTLTAKSLSVSAGLLPEDAFIKTVEWEMLDKSKFFPMSMATSFTIRCFLYPLTLIRTRLQVQRGKKNILKPLFKPILWCYF